MYYVLGGDGKPKLATYSQAVDFCSGSMRKKLSEHGQYAVWFSGIDLSGGAAPLPLCFFVSGQVSVVAKHWALHEAVAAAEKLAASEVSVKLTQDAAAVAEAFAKLAEAGSVTKGMLIAMSTSLALSQPLTSKPLIPWWSMPKPATEPPKPEPPKPEAGPADDSDPLTQDGPRRFLL